jgi:hypothetical protein
MRHQGLARLCGAVLVGLAAVPAAAVELPSSATPMSPDDVTKVFAGKTLLGPASDTFVATTGTTKGVYGKPKIIDTFTGTWTVSDNQFCMENVSPHSASPARECIKLWRDGRRIYTLWSERSDGVAVDEVNGYTPYLPKTRQGDVVSQRYQKAGGQ